jgi:ATP adenylyltransferase
MALSAKTSLIAVPPENRQARRRRFDRACREGIHWVVCSHMSELRDCFYCRKDQRLHDLMIEIAPLEVSTLYLFKEQTYKGRCVVASRLHVNELFELPKAEIGLFMADVARAAKAMKAAFGAAKINYGAYADKLPHLHMHLVPKYQDGPSWGTTFTMMPEPKKIISDAEYAQMIGAIKAQLG